MRNHPLSYGPVPKNRTRQVLAVLLEHADQNWGCWVDRERPQIRIRMDKEELRNLIGVNQKEWKNQTIDVLSHYLKDFLKILVDERTATQGSDEWQFSLNLWSTDKRENLAAFERKWEEARQARSKSPTTSKPPAPTSIDWHAECETLLKKHKENLASNDLQATTAKNFGVYVPLGVVKREQKQRPKIDRNFDPTAEKGSELYQEKAEPISHDKFLQTVRDRQSPERHIAILGEPGAGKTTLLTKVWQDLIENCDKPQIVAWVPLAALKDKDLIAYLKQDWIRQICPTPDIPPSYWESFQELATAGRVWLLLDGADEIGGDGLTTIANILKQGWTQGLRAIVTCRLNLWDAGNNGLRQSFQILTIRDFIMWQ